jgi:hypothetical protein
MDHHGSGWHMNAHPSYLMEKIKLLDCDEEFAFRSLDHQNQIRVIEYHKLWHLKIPHFLEDFVRMYANE